MYVAPYNENIFPAGNYLFKVNNRNSSCDVFVVINIYN